MTTDDIVYQARLHWIMYVWPVIIFCLVIVVGVYFPFVRQASVLFGTLVLLWGLATYCMARFCSLTIKKTQITLQTGVFARQVLDIPFHKIESVNVRQPILGTILGYGTIEITGTGGTRELVTYLSKPLTCRRYIEQMMHGS